MKHDSITKKTFQEAVKIFHKLAYPGKEFPQGMYAGVLESVLNSDTLVEVFSHIQKFNPDLSIDDWDKKIIIPIGCDRFPFLKLVLQESPISGEYGFLVDRHSEFLGHKISESYQKEVELKKYLGTLKESIETAFEQAGLPSYRYLIRQYVKKKREDNLAPEIRGTVLLAEDEPDVHDLYKMEIELLGYAVCSAFSGEDVLSMVDETRFDCLILDLMMPGVSGLDVLEEIGREQKCVVLSAVGDDNTKNTCRQFGAIDFLEKPAEQTILEKTLDKIV